MKNGLIIDEYGTKWWYKNNLLHNENGPAVEYSDGTKRWFINGKRHRLDGLAIEYIDCERYWFYEGQRIYCNSQEEFEYIIKLKVLW